MSSQSSGENSTQWLQDAIDLRRTIRDHLIALPNEYPQDTFIAFNEFHQDAQKFLFEYYSMFEPAKGQLGASLAVEDADEGEIGQSLWKGPIDTVRIPVSGRIRLNGQSAILKNNMADRNVLASISHLVPTEPVTVTLGNLRKFFHSDASIQLSVRGWIENQGEVSETISSRRYLSPALIYQARLQLDRCLAKTGKVPDFTEDGRPYNDWRKEFEDGVYAGPDSVDLPHKHA